MFKKYKKFLDKNIDKPINNIRIIKKFKSFESLDYEEFTGDIDDMTVGEIKTLENLLLETESDLMLNDLISNLKDIKKHDEIILYRLIWIKDKENIDIKKLGNHYVGSLNSFDNEWISNLYPFYHRENEPDIENDLWLVTILVPTEDIDYKATLVKNIKFPYEEEIQLKNNSNIKIIDISKYY